MESFSHHENFSYDERKGGFVVEVPVPPGRGKVSRATRAVLKDHLELDVRLTRGGKRTTDQPSRPLEECYSWWLGQLIHHGLPLVLSTDEAKQTIKNAILSNVLRVPRELKKMEQRMRNAIIRRAKREGETSAKESTLEAQGKSIKAEPDMSNSEEIIHIVRTPSSRRRSQTQMKLETSASCEGESEEYTPDAGTDSETVEEVSKSAPKAKGSSARKQHDLAANQVQAGQLSRMTSSTRKASLESLSEVSSEESDDSDLEDIPHSTISTEEVQTSAETESDLENGSGIVPAFTKPLTTRHSFGDENAHSGSFSDDSEYERAVVSHSQAINGAKVMYGHTDKDSSSESSYNNETELQSTRQSPAREPDDEKNTHKMSQLASNDTLKPSASKTSPMSKDIPSTRSMELKIKRDRKPRSQELESASDCETTPSRTPKKQKKQDHHQNDHPERAESAATTANVHPDMTYDDIVDPVTRHKIARMRSMFPKETIYLCYTCLAKHSDNFDEGCEELTNARLSLTPNASAPAAVQDIQATSSGRKRKRSSRPKEVTVQASSPGKSQAAFTLSDPDEPIIKQEPTPKRRKALKTKNRASLISDQMHSSQLDLTIVDDSQTSEEAESKAPNKRLDSKKSTASEKVSPKPIQSASVESSWFSAAKARTAERENAEREKTQITFPSSPPVGLATKGILKSSPLFKERDSLLGQAVDSAGPSFSHHRKRSSDVLLQTQQHALEPELPPQLPLRKSQHKAAPQHHVSWNPYATESGPQAMNPISKSKMRLSGQIEVETHPEPRRTLFSTENNRIVGLSRQDGGGLLQRGLVRNPSISNST